MELAELISGDDTVLLDVRERAEWDAGHIAGTRNIPLSEFAARQGEVPTDRRLVCICRSGNRSGTVTQALLQAGYDAQNFEGGMLAWVEAGGDVVTSTGAAGRVI